MTLENESNYSNDFSSDSSNVTVFSTDKSYDLISPESLKGLESVYSIHQLSSAEKTTFQIEPNYKGLSTPTKNKYTHRITYLENVIVNLRKNLKQLKQAGVGKARFSHLESIDVTRRRELLKIFLCNKTKRIKILERKVLSTSNENKKLKKVLLSLEKNKELDMLKYQLSTVKSCLNEVRLEKDNLLKENKFLIQKKKLLEKRLLRGGFHDLAKEITYLREKVKQVRKQNSIKPNFSRVNKKKRQCYNTSIPVTKVCGKSKKENLLHEIYRLRVCMKHEILKISKLKQEIRNTKEQSIAQHLESQILLHKEKEKQNMLRLELCIAKKRLKMGTKITKRNNVPSVKVIL